MAGDRIQRATKQLGPQETAQIPVDTSSAQIAQTVSSVALGFAKELSANRKTAKLVDAELKYTEFLAGAQKLSSEMRVEFDADPEGYLKEFDTRAKAGLDSFVNGIEDVQVRSLVSRMGKQAVAVSGIDNARWAVNQGRIVNQEKYNATMVSRVDVLASASDADVLLTLVEESRQFMDAALAPSSTLDEKTVLDVSNKAIKQGVDNYFFRLADTGVEAIDMGLAELKNGRYDGLLSAEDRQSKTEDLMRTRDNKVKQKNYEVNKEATTIARDLRLELFDNPASITQEAVNNFEGYLIINDLANKDGYSSLLKGLKTELTRRDDVQVPGVSSPTAKVDMYNFLRSFVSSNKEGQIKTDETYDPEKLASYIDKVHTAYTNGELTNEDYKRYMDQGYSLLNNSFTNVFKTRKAGIFRGAQKPETTSKKAGASELTVDFITDIDTYVDTHVKDEKLGQAIKATAVVDFFDEVSRVGGLANALEGDQFEELGVFTKLVTGNIKKATMRALLSELGITKEQAQDETFIDANGNRVKFIMDSDGNVIDAKAGG